MTPRRIWILALLALGAASCQSSSPASKPAGDPAAGSVPAQAPARAAPPTTPAPAFADIDVGLDALRARFQEDDGMVRVVMLVAPT